MAPKIKPKKGPSIISSYVSKNASKESLKNDNCLNISFRHLDTTQGASLEEWSQNGYLLSTVTRLKELCSSTFQQLLGNVIAIYGSFPEGRSDFYHPKHVPEDANWGRVHINGTHIIAGHFVEGIFYVVFLDNDHKFYKVELKNT